MIRMLFVLLVLLASGNWASSAEPVKACQCGAGCTCSTPDNNCGCLGVSTSADASAAKPTHLPPGCIKYDKTKRGEFVCQDPDGRGDWLWQQDRQCWSRSLPVSFPPAPIPNHPPGWYHAPMLIPMQQFNGGFGGGFSGGGACRS